MDDTWMITRTEDPSEGYGVYAFYCNGQYVTRAVQYDTAHLDPGDYTWDLLGHGGNNDMFRAPPGSPDRFGSLNELVHAVISRWEDSSRREL